jgi:hypothetical protein
MKTVLIAAAVCTCAMIVEAHAATPSQMMCVEYANVRNVTCIPSGQSSITMMATDPKNLYPDLIASMCNRLPEEMRRLNIQGFQIIVEVYPNGLPITVCAY